MGAAELSSDALWECCRNPPASWCQTCHHRMRALLFQVCQAHSTQPRRQNSCTKSHLLSSCSVSCGCRVKSQKWCLFYVVRRGGPFMFDRGPHLRPPAASPPAEQPPAAHIHPPPHLHSSKPAAWSGGASGGAGALTMWPWGLLSRLAERHGSK